MAYKPNIPYTVPAYLLIPTEEIIKGVQVKTYPKPNEGELIFCSFKTYGGTEQNVNGVRSVIDTATIETWYRPDIKAKCRLCLADNLTKFYEVEGEPENINRRNQWLLFKVKAVAGGA